MSHEITALIQRMVHSYYSEDGREYVVGVHTNHLGNGKAVFSGEPAVFRQRRVHPKPLERLLNEEERQEYMACLERMHEAWKGRDWRYLPTVQLALSSLNIPSVYMLEKELALQPFNPPLFLPS